MSSLRYSTLVQRARRNELSRSEVSDLIRGLSDLSDGDELYDVLFAIGQAGEPTDAPVIEPYLERPDDPMLSRLALTILCNWWALRREYRSQTLRFVEGVSWDLADGGYVRLVAIAAAGETARDDFDSSIVRTLLQLVESGDEQPLFRSAAYSALMRAAGKAWSDVPGTGSDEWWKHPDRMTLDELRASTRGH